MGTIVTVRFMEGDIAEQLFLLKVSALTNHDMPSIWRLTEGIMELLLASAGRVPCARWPAGYVSEDRLFGVPVDYVRQMPHLLCEDYVVYPFASPDPRILRAH